PANPLAGEAPGEPSGRLSANVSGRLSLLKVTSRLSTPLSFQPPWLSPGRRRTIFWLARSRKTAIASPAPTTAPISASGGCSASAEGGGGATAGSAAGATTAGCGGRREAEKTGRAW